jgi:hypothetical protein
MRRKTPKKLHGAQVPMKRKERKKLKETRST